MDKMMGERPAEWTVGRFKFVCKRIVQSCLIVVKYKQ